LVRDNATTRNAGRMVPGVFDFPELCLEGVWRRVCTGGRRWRVVHTNLACKQLGFAGRGESINTENIVLDYKHFNIKSFCMYHVCKLITSAFYNFDSNLNVHIATD